MGKYERSLKQVQLKNLVAENNLDKALELVGEMVNEKGSDYSDLKMYAEVYNKCGVYDKAKELYQKVYNNLPTRRNLYNLIVMCAKGGFFEEAEKLLSEYEKKDPESVSRYILRYRIDKEAGASDEIILNDIENVVDTEYSEKWAYELVRMYYKMELYEDCSSECKDIITWFAEGEIVNKVRKILNSLAEDEKIPVETLQEEPEPEEDEPLANESFFAMEPSVSEDEPEDPDTFTVGEELATTENPVVEEEKTAFEERPAEISEKEQEPVAEVKIPEEIISLDIFKDVQKGESLQEEIQFSKFVDDIPYIHYKLFFSDVKNINIKKLSFVVAANKNEDAEKTIHKLAKIVRKVKGGSHRIAKITAEKLNAIDFENEMDKLEGACVLIENASNVSSKTINSIIKTLEVYPDRFGIILMDTEENLSRMFFREQILKNQIAHFIYVS